MGVSAITLGVPAITLGVPAIIAGVSPSRSHMFLMYVCTYLRDFSVFSLYVWNAPPSMYMLLYVHVSSVWMPFKCMSLQVYLLLRVYVPLRVYLFRV